MITKGSIIENTCTDDLTERIKIIYYSRSRNNRGDIIKGKENLRYECWAKVIPLSAKINDATPERTNRITYRVTIRYRKNILSDDVIIWRGKYLKMISPAYDVESRKIWLIMNCEEVVKDGK